LLSLKEFWFFCIVCFQSAEEWDLANPFITGVLKVVQIDEVLKIQIFKAREDEESAQNEDGVKPLIVFESGFWIEIDIWKLKNREGIWSILWMWIINH